jgi:hypothetical protein
MSHDDDDMDEAVTETLRRSSLDIPTGGSPAPKGSRAPARSGGAPWVRLDDHAIRAACNDISLVSASFPGDTESWAKIIKQHLLAPTPLKP